MSVRCNNIRQPCTFCVRKAWRYWTFICLALLWLQNSTTVSSAEMFASKRCDNTGRPSILPFVTSKPHCCFISWDVCVREAWQYWTHVQLCFTLCNFKTTPLSHLLRCLCEKGVTILDVHLPLPRQEGELTVLRVAGSIWDPFQLMEHVHTLFRTDKTKNLNTAVPECL